MTALFLFIYRTFRPFKGDYVEAFLVQSDDGPALHLSPRVRGGVLTLSLCIQNPPSLAPWWDATRRPPVQL